MLAGRRSAEVALAVRCATAELAQTFGRRNSRFAMATDVSAGKRSEAPARSYGGRPGVIPKLFASKHLLNRNVG